MSISLLEHKLSQVKIPTSWNAQSKNGYTNRKQLLEDRKKFLIADPSFDLDGDGFVS